MTQYDAKNAENDLGHSQHPLPIELGAVNRCLGLAKVIEEA